MSRISRQLPCVLRLGLGGANTFAQGGIHQDGVLKDARTYEIMTPNPSAHLSRSPHARGKLYGRAALAAQMRDLGDELEKEQLNRAFGRAGLLLGKKEVLEEMDMHYIVETTVTTTAQLGNG